MAISWHVANCANRRTVTMIQALDFFKTVKGISIAIGVLAVLVFLIFRSCNKYISETENEVIPIENITVKPSDANANCLRITGKPCPTISK
jgi:hypothetical protein